MKSPLKATLKYMPKWIAKLFAGPYVAGETTHEALSKVAKLNAKGFRATLDILGEHTVNKMDARNVAAEYCSLYEKIEGNNLDCTISVKPTHIGLDISIEEAMSNMIKIQASADKYANFLRIDMESSEYTNHTFEIYSACKKISKNVGFALQAYLYRSEDDLKTFRARDLNVRICKGIYKEHPKIAYQKRSEINSNFLVLAKEMARSGGFCGYATHDLELIDQLLDWVKKERISPKSFEFQALYGVPMSGRLEELINDGYSVRIYVPYGPDWFDYSIRRLDENPDIAFYVISNLFKRRNILT